MDLSKLLTISGLLKYHKKISDKFKQVNNDIEGVKASTFSLHIDGEKKGESGKPLNIQTGNNVTLFSNYDSEHETNNVRIDVNIDSMDDFDVEDAINR